MRFNHSYYYYNVQVGTKIERHVITGKLPGSDPRVPGLKHGV